MQQAAIYARYSTDRQQQSSIEDQVRQARAQGAREGLTVAAGMVFTDEAVSGHGAAGGKRIGFRRLLDAWDAGLVDIVFAHELSRLTRDIVTGLELMRRMQATGVAVVTCDGIDTRRPGWESLFLMRLMMTGEEGRQTASRVSRTMEGLLERGGMIGAPPFGYRVDWTLGPSRDPPGARWVIDESTADVVRTLFRLRKTGLSVAKLAKYLNSRGISSPRCGRDGQPAFWRPATVHKLLTNAIYKGVFVYLGSAYTRAKLKRRRETPKPTAYAREQFRLVSDEMWAACNPREGVRRIRGGTRHVLAGFMVCGECGCTLSVSGVKSALGLHCPSCEQAVRVGARATYIGYTSVNAATRALKASLAALMEGPALDEFRNRLRARVTAGPADEEARMKLGVQRLTTARGRLVRLATNPEIGIDVVELELKDVNAELRETTRRLEYLKRERSPISKAAVERQVAVELAPLLERLVHGEPLTHEVRATLGRLIPRFALVAHPRRGCSVFEVTVVPGAYIAESTRTPELDSIAVIFRVTVSATAQRPTRWDVDIVRM
ncbi:MAG: recombinase family protein [Casimicrobiaceae bacterium]